MSNFTVFDPVTGRILRSGGCPDWQITAQAQTGEVVLPILANGLTQYISNNTPVEIPLSPGNSYQWDAVNKVWTLNLGLGQSLAWTRIKSARDAAIASGVTYNGNVYDSDATAQLRLTGAAQMAQIAISSGTAFSVTWTLQNNSTVTLTASEVIALATTVGQNYQTLFGKGQSLRSQIMAATTQSELDAITW
ncbi:DUF4376 domain-containing protein [Ferrovum sp.]|uniref:DUF4376 domain-containing protein n=1 Tax=Ferrovum sp. TaxID=2609467 RepID=UPI0026263FAF|nr:DUF4376 domain-containing protein [Ferrovum sp.]